MSGSEIQAQLLENLFDGTCSGGHRGRRPPRRCSSCCSDRCWRGHATPAPAHAALLMLGLVTLPWRSRSACSARAACCSTAATPGLLSAVDLGCAARSRPGRVDTPAAIARGRGAGPARTQRAHRRRARGGPAHPDREPAAARPPKRRRARRAQRGPDAGPGSGRRSVRLLHARRRPTVPAHRRRRRQGPVGIDLHGGEQGALQGLDDPHPGCGHRRHHARRQRGGVARQRRDAFRHRVRRHPRPAQWRARLLQRGPRESLSAPVRRRRGRAPQRRRRPAAVHDGRLRVPQRALPADPAEICCAS